MNAMMADMDLPYPLQRRMRRYMHESKQSLRQRVHRHTLEDNISAGLQREVFQCSSYVTLLQGIYWARDIEQDALLELCKRFRPYFFAPNEVVLLRQVILVLMRGIMALKGRILGRNDIWGYENILLESKQLMDTAQPRTLSYVRAMGLEKDDLLDVARLFPAVDRRLRRAQVRTAVYRAFILASIKKKMELEKVDDAPVQETTQMPKVSHDASPHDHGQLARLASATASVFSWTPMLLNPHAAGPRLVSSGSFVQAAVKDDDTTGKVKVDVKTNISDMERRLDARFDKLQKQMTEMASSLANLKRSSR